mmetsp:Transcript_35247/g.112109  ORF Transcript_35247/g.112109 Transcript_35247/m.112109 type:complete len:283 (+) Transcript_35247:80-928(+)
MSEAFVGPLVAAICTVLLLPVLTFLVCYLCMTFSLHCNRCMPTCLKRAVAMGVRLLKCRDVKPFTISHVSGGLYIGSMPRTEEHMAELVDTGIKYVITMNEPWEYATRSQVLDKATFQQAGLQWLVLPTPDYNPPSLADVIKGVNWCISSAGSNCLSDRHPKNEGVYVHCNAGKGRSAVVTICILIHLGDMTAKEAFNMVRARRRISRMGPCKGRCLRTTQWKTIADYERRHCKASSKPPVEAWASGLEQAAEKIENDRNVEAVVPSVENAEKIELPGVCAN